MFNTSKAIETERDFPHIVEIAVPQNGLELRLSRKILTFHSAHNIRPRYGRIRGHNNECYFRWCFTDSAIADIFRRLFAGERVTNKP